MAKLTVKASRGALLEELVLKLLKMVGYRIIADPDPTEGTRNGGAGLELRGRGEWHQIDALAAFDRTPAFMYPLRLLVEAKCYQKKSRVGIGIVRNSVGVLKDIDENFFSYSLEGDSKDDSARGARFNYRAAIFSSSGYSKPALRYALAHQIYLIQYKDVSLMGPVINGLLALRKVHIRTNADIKRLRRSLGAALNGDLRALRQGFTGNGAAHIERRVIEPFNKIGASYFGVLQGKWPMQLFSERALPPMAFMESDEVECRLYGMGANRWSFVPDGIDRNSEDYFRLEFDLPDEIVLALDPMRDDALQVANLKEQHFAFLDVSGRIGGVQRQIRLKLSREWWQDYVHRIRNRRNVEQN